MAYNYTQASLMKGVSPELINAIRNVLTDEYQQITFQVNRMQALLTELADREAQMAAREQRIARQGVSITEQLNAAEQLNLATMALLNKLINQ